MSTLGEGLRPLAGEPDEAFSRALGERLDARWRGALPALASVAAVSPYLKHLMLGDPRGVEGILAAPLERTVAEATAVPPAADLGAVGAALRRGKARVALAVALADLVGGADVATITGALSDMADAAVRVALASVLMEASKRGAINAGADPATSGLVILGLGKLGARELNYSSDIDIVALHDPARAEPCGIDGARAARLVQAMARLLNERTAEGYVFRVDLRLRPDPGSTPVAVSTRAAIHYYQSRARPWERQAMIKARQVAGDLAAGEAYLRAVEPSVWRTTYDFTAIADTMDMRDRIAMVRGAGTLTLPGHDVKLGRGGIREIEFFVQSLQCVVGGRDRHLRERGTIAMLRRLAEAGWIAAGTCAELTAAYERLRRVEHRLQMIADEQTHVLPDAQGLPLIALMMDEPDFEARLLTTFETVHRHFLSLSLPADQTNPLLAEIAAAAAPRSAALEAALDDAFKGWLSGSHASLRTERARRLLADLRADFAFAIAASPDPQETLKELDTFFARLPAGVALLARLDLHRGLVGVLVFVVSAAPRLAAELARRSHLLDVLVDPAFFGTLPDRTALSAQLDEAVRAARDYEGRLDAMRVFGQEQALLINVRILTGSLVGAEAGEATTRLAEVIVERALAVARTEFEARHGRIAGGTVALLALGKFGGREMTARSDLDIVFLYGCAPDCGESDGAKPLSPGHYFTRLAQRFIAALSAPTARGTLYEVDLRLRPSGRAGPIATHIRSFRRYHAESAWAWEHMALTRARVIAGEAELREEALAAVRASIAAERDGAALAPKVAHMRRRMAEHAEAGLKHMPGGQVDVEFVAQFLQLAHGLADVGGQTATDAGLARARAAGVLPQEAYETLISAHRLYQRLSQIVAVAASGEIDPAGAPTALQRLLLRAGEAPDVDFLAADLSERRTAVRGWFERLVAPMEERADPA